MSDLSSYMGNTVLRWLGGNAFPAAPAGVYLALFNGDPTAGGTEVTTTVLAAGRLQATFGANVPAAGSVNNMDNDALIDFGGSDGACTIDHVALYDAQSGGNLLFSRAITPVTVNVGTGVSVAAGAMTVTVGAPGA